MHCSFLLKPPCEPLQPIKSASGRIKPTWLLLFHRSSRTNRAGGPSLWEVATFAGDIQRVPDRPWWSSRPLHGASDTEDFVVQQSDRAQFSSRRRFKTTQLEEPPLHKHRSLIMNTVWDHYVIAFPPKQTPAGWSLDQRKEKKPGGAERLVAALVTPDFCHKKTKTKHVYLKFLPKSNWCHWQSYVHTVQFFPFPNPWWKQKLSDAPLSADTRNEVHHFNGPAFYNLRPAWFVFRTSAEQQKN